MDTLEEQKAYIDELYAGKEKQNKVRESYFANYQIDSSKFHWNVSFLDGRKINNIDLFVGGSPCQSFSLVGKQRGLGDTRGTLFYEYARLVGEIRPKVFIYENVRAILSNDNGRTWETMTKIFEDLGYSWSFKILNAKDYGIPQNRERVFVVGFRNDLEVTDFKFPQPRELKTKMQDYLLDNVSGKYYLPKKGVEFVTSNKNLEKRYTQIDGEIQLCQKKNQQFNWHGDFVFEEERKDKEHLIEDLEKYFLSEKVKKYVLSSGTKGFYSKPEIDLEVARPLLTTMHKMHRAGIDNYVTTEGRLRKLTPRECLRLMGFCDSFKIVVSDTAMYQQSGNSIVVDVLIGILKQIFKCVPSIIN
jgi:DNA (cytosine-5-)-methyltransferase